VLCQEVYSRAGTWDTWELSHPRSRPLSTYKPTPLRRDHARPRHHPHALDPIIQQHLTELVRPATFALADHYRRLGLRERVLTLPVMLSLVLTLIWRQVPTVSELVRMLARDPLLWSPPIHVSQQAVSERLRSLPAALFREVAHAVLPPLQARSAARSRPIPAVIARAQQHFAHLWIADATKLEALFKKVGALREVEGYPHGGTLLGLLDLPSKLPVHLVWDANSALNERRLLDRVKALLVPGTLLLFDGGFLSFPLFDWCTDQRVSFITRPHADAAYAVVRVLQETELIRDRIIQYGQYRSNPCRHPVRLVEIRTARGWYRYVTNVLDPAVLPAADIADLYARRWRIEDAFSLVKRLLGLSYLWTGAANGIQLQVWATWLLYAVLIDLCDQVAEVKGLPLERISVEMVYRGLYHFAGAVQRGEATDPVAYLAAQTDLGIVKRLRHGRTQLDKQRQILNL
jgi:Transposase DDE domain